MLHFQGGSTARPASGAAAGPGLSWGRGQGPHFPTWPRPHVLGLPSVSTPKSKAEALTTSTMYPWESQASRHLPLLAKEVTGVHPGQGEGTQTHLLLGGWQPRKQKIITSSPRGKYQTGNQRPKVRPHSFAIHSHPQFYVPHFQIFIFISKTGPLLQASPFPNHVPSLPRPPHHHGCTAPSSSLAVSQLGQHPAPAPDLPLPLPVGVASQRCLSLSSPPAGADALTFTTALHVLRPGIQEALNQC